MRFGFLSECETPEGTTHHRRYWEVMDEVVLAEEMGFDFFGTSEQHFLVGLATVSAPEVFYPAIAMRTSRIRLRHMVVLLPFPFNHPIRVAERLATLDIVSNGRAELGTGRANTLVQLEGFACPLDETRARWEEALEVVMKAFKDDPFSHEGRYFQIPPRSLTPKPVQDPHPPVYMVAQSPDSHEIAARKGIGALSWDMYMGWDYFEKSARLYKEQIQQAEPVGAFVTNCLSAVTLNCACAETTAQAVEETRESILNFATPVIESFYPDLGRQAKSYAYMLELEKIRDRSRDLDWLRNETSVLVGDPDVFIERIGRYREVGADEVIMRLDGTHEQIMRSIKLIGKYVIPKFKTPRSVIGTSPLPGRVP